MDAATAYTLLAAICRMFRDVLKEWQPMGAAQSYRNCYEVGEPSLPVRLLSRDFRKSLRDPLLDDDADKPLLALQSGVLGGQALSAPASGLSRSSGSGNRGPRTRPGRYRLSHSEHEVFESLVIKVHLLFVV